MNMVSRLLVSSMALALALAACRQDHDPVGAPDCVAPPVDIGCKPLDCGGNSRVVNTFPVNGFTKGGQGACNIAGVQLLPQSLQGGGCGSGADLGLDPTGTRLIGTRRGEVVCRGERLAGAAFAVRSFAGATLAFTIAQVRPIQGLHDKTYEGYRIESGGASACDPGVAQRVRDQLGPVAQPETRSAGLVAALPTPAGYQPGPHDDLVIAVDGPLYDGHDQLFVDSRARWFNLACAGDALAKRTLYDLHVAGNDASNDTALRMLTANYCGKPYTVPGVEIAWLRHDMRPTLEARWRAGKAACIDNPRLMTLRVTEGEIYSPALLPAQLQPRGCDQGESCDANRWIAALRAECQLPSCESSEGTFEFESYSADGAKALLSRPGSAPESGD